MKLFDDKDEEEKVWEIRESGLGATAHIPGEKDTWPGWEDSAIPPDCVGDYLRDFKGLMKKYNFSAALYGHFGQGCIHTRIPFDLRTTEGIKTFRSFVYEAADIVNKYNGSFSGEHGDGQARGELLPKMFGEDIVDAFRQFKSIWDPDWKMNPGKVIDPYKIDENLRLGTDYNPRNVDTYFKYPTDDGNFSEAVLRCVGVGKCRRHGGGTMCPSYMVTREEMHSTRGRARMLFEMLQGESIKEGWHSEHIKDALDLCLACKGCKSDCPVNVDMATYKAEFLSHYYENKIRPRTAYAMGLIYWNAKIGSKIPRIANFFTQTSGLSSIAKFMAGISPERKIPPFAKQTFRSWFKKNAPVQKENRPKIILWPDTFNNNFHPETIIAAVEVLDKAGYNVEIPKIPLCCGRPLYDYGFLKLAKHLLRQTLSELKPQIDAGIPVVGLEPSCTAVFRDELIELFPNNEDAKRLNQQTFQLSEFLTQSDRWKIPQLNRKAVVHGHCHHKAIMGLDAEEEILKRMNLDYNVLDSGCCGMAGAFGFEKGKYDVSVKCGERVLLPAVRDAEENTLIIANGFSCRTQVMQLTKRRPLHIAEVLSMIINNSDQKHPDDYPNEIIKKNGVF